MQKNNKDPKMNRENELEERVVEVKSVTKVNKGVRQRRFSATVVVGDRKVVLVLVSEKLLKFQMLLRRPFKLQTKN